MGSFVVREAIVFRGVETVRTADEKSRINGDGGATTRPSAIKLDVGVDYLNFLGRI